MGRPWIEHSGKPFPIQGARLSESETVDAGTIPRWLAELAYARFFRQWNVPESTPPTIDEIEMHGGFNALFFLDLMAGGTGDGAAYREIEGRTLGLLALDLTPRTMARPPKKDAGVILLESASIFPQKGGRISDGTGLEKSIIPRWLAEIAHRRFAKIAATRGVLDKVPRLEQIEKNGGFHPFELLDLLAGGDGSGKTYAAQESPKLRAKIAALFQP